MRVQGSGFRGQGVGQHPFYLNPEPHSSTLKLPSSMLDSG
jgi:hypothetical protein